MEDNIVIKVENLHKKFCLNLKRSMFYGTVDIVRSMLGISYNRGKLRESEFWALEGIDFEVKKGETFGLVGANGSGKSTLLRLINGIYPPDKGKISVRGKIGALIAVGAGFHPHMTGRENIYLNGTILGMTKEEIDKDFQNIIDFAEVGEFIDAPVSTYSSGMYVRLGFAIAIHSKPDIMLVDEILAVGDAKFQRKCLDKIKEMRKSGVTFFLVTHNMQNIEAMCNRALLMDHGKQIMIGTPQEIVPVYELMQQTGKEPQEIKGVDEGELIEKNELKFINRYSDFGTDEVTVKNIKLYNNESEYNQDIWSDKKMTVSANILSKINASAMLYLTFTLINDRDDEDKNFCSLALRKNFKIPSGESELKLHFDKAQLTTGEYKVGFFVFDETFSMPYFQGYFGYFSAKSSVPTMLRVGAGTPFCWAEPQLEIKKTITIKGI